MCSSIATVRSATASSRARSWETSRIEPGNASSAASSASRLSRSRWFVGSSSTRKFAPEATIDRERQPPPLAAGQHRHLLLLLGVAREEELAEQVLRLRPGQPGHRDGAVEHRAALVELHLVLREVGRLDAVAEADRARVGRAIRRRASRAASSCPSRSGRRGRCARRARSRASRRRAAACRPPRAAALRSRRRSGPCGPA